MLPYIAAPWILWDMEMLMWKYFLGLNGTINGSLKVSPNDLMAIYKEYMYIYIYWELMGFNLMVGRLDGKITM